MTPATEVTELLSVESTAEQRMTALIGLLSADSLRSGLGKTPEAYKAWLTGAGPRRDAARALDNLRCTVLTLITGGKRPEQVEAWLTSRLSPHAVPAIDLILRRPEAVLAAADADAESRAVAVDLLEAATASLEQERAENLQDSATASPTRLNG